MKVSARTILAQAYERELKQRLRDGLRRDYHRTVQAPLSSECAKLVDSLRQRLRCLIPEFDGALFSPAWKDALWARYCTGAPARQRRSVERYSIVKRA
jgi:hypothetical protein